MRRSALITVAFILPLACFTAPPSFPATCSASAALDLKLETNPNAENYTARGIWFDENRQFSCAAEDFQKASQLDPSSARIAFKTRRSRSESVR